MYVFFDSTRPAGYVWSIEAIEWWMFGEPVASVILMCWTIACVGVRYISGTTDMIFRIGCAPIIGCGGGFHFTY